MAIQKETVEVMFSGLREDVDPKLLPEGNFTVLKNLEYNKEGRLEKRAGYDLFTQADDEAIRTISDGKALIASDKGLLMADGYRAYVYREGDVDSWNVLGSFKPCSISSRANYYDTVDKTILDFAVVDDLNCFLVQDTDLSYIDLHLIDKNNGSVVHSMEISGTGTATVGRVVANNGTVCVLYNEGADLFLRKFDQTGKEVDEKKLYYDYFDTTINQLDACYAYDGVICFVFSHASGFRFVKTRISDYAKRSYNQATVVGSVLNIKMHYSDDDVAYVYAANNSSQKYMYKFTLNAILLDPTLDTSRLLGTYVTNPCRGILTWVRYESTYYITSIAEIDAADDRDNTIETNGANEGLTKTMVPPTVLDNCWLISDVASITEPSADVGAYIIVGYPSSLQPTYYLMALVPGDVEYQWINCGKFLIGEAITRHDGKHAITNINEAVLNPSVYATGLPRRTVTTDYAGNADYVNYELRKVTITFPDSPQYRNFNEVTYIANAGIKQYDGRTILDACFNTYPEIISLTEVAGGSMANGDYQYKVVYELVDVSGNVMYSAPSPASSITITGATGQACELVVHGPNLHDNDLENTVAAPELTMRLAVYRTTASGSIYYLVHRENQVLPGTKYTLNYSAMSSADSSITDNGKIYTNGNELENISLPSVKCLEVHKNRLWAVATDEPDKLYYSKKKVRGETVGFYSDAFKRYDYDIVAITSFQGNMFVFSTDTISYIAGDGPDATGANDTFSDFILVSSDVGCVNLDSLISTDMGVFFESRKGIYLLQSGNVVNFIGGPAQDLISNNTILAAANHPAKLQARWLLDNGSYVVFDYRYNQWLEHQFNTNLIDIVEYNGDFYQLYSNGKVYKETPGDYGYGDSFFQFSATTGWINLNGITGYQRLYDIYLLGHYKSDHTLNVRIYYDYDDNTLVESKTFDATTLDTREDYIVRIRPTRQKCRAIKLQIYDSAQSGTYESAYLHGLRFVYGRKGINAQIRQGKSI